MAAGGPVHAPTVPPPIAPVPSAPRNPSVRIPARLLAAGAGLVALVALALVLTGVIGGSASPAEIAGQINLNVGDLLGFRAQPRSHSADGALDARAQGCQALQNKGHSSVAGVKSPMFTGGTGLQVTEIESDVSIEQSPAVVAHDFALVSSSELRACMTRVFEGVTLPTPSGNRVTISGVAVVPVQVSAQGSNQSFGLRMTMTMSANGINVPVVMDLFGFGVGHDELSLMLFTVAQPPFAPREQQLSSLLVSRALARPH
jgi:hypothetical protein